MVGISIGPECEFCFGHDDVQTADGLTECRDCRSYRLWYNALTPAEKRAEHESSARYVQETIERGDG